MHQNRIIKFAYAAVLLSFLLSTAVSLWSLHVMNLRNEREINRVLAARIYDTISGELSEPVVVARTMASDRLLANVLVREPTLPEGEAEAVLGDYLTGIKDGLGCEAAFVISDASKRYYSYNGVNKVIDPEHDDHDHWYTDFLAKDLPYVIEVDNDEAAHGAWTVFVNARIGDGRGGALGVCGVGVHMTESQALFRDLEAVYHVKIDLVDPTGLIQVDTDETRIQTEYLDTGILAGTGGRDYVYHELEGGHYAVSRYVDQLGWFLVVQSDGTGEAGQFLNVILLNLVLCLLVMGILVAALRTIVRRHNDLSNASFRDQLTHLYNRRAFEEEKARLHMAPLEESFVYMTADVNGLKTVNDTLGHVAGDELILGAAQCLKSAFGRYGTIYRIGGDEFAAMLSLSPDRLTEAQAALAQAVDGWSGEKVDRLSISCGYASSREFPSENLAELSRISDERMYEAKAEYYRQSGNDRRRT